MRLSNLRIICFFCNPQGKITEYKSINKHIKIFVLYLFSKTNKKSYKPIKTLNDKVP